MKNGLFSIHIHMLDGVRGRDSGVTILRDGHLISGGPYFWSVGSYTAANGQLEGALFHQPAHALCRSLRALGVRRAGGHQRIFRNLYRRRRRGVRHHAGRRHRSLSFHATLKRLAGSLIGRCSQLTATRACPAAAGLIARTCRSAMKPTKPSTSIRISSQAGMLHPTPSAAQRPAGIRRRRRGLMCSCLSNAGPTWEAAFRSAPTQKILRNFSRCSRS